MDVFELVFNYSDRPWIEHEKVDRIEKIIGFRISNELWDAINDYADSAMRHGFKEGCRITATVMAQAIT